MRACLWAESRRLWTRDRLETVGGAYLQAPDWWMGMRGVASRGLELEERPDLRGRGSDAPPAVLLRIFLPHPSLLSYPRQKKSKISASRKLQLKVRMSPGEG